MKNLAIMSGLNTIKLFVKVAYFFWATLYFKTDCRRSSY